MSHAAINSTGHSATLPDPHAHAGNHHDPHLAHHFDTPEQQYSSAKLGMWVFLGTEILMFGGLFCAYAVYRHNHPDVFQYAHQFLDRWLGAINTVVLITSSLTMAWAVRSSQLGNQQSLRWLLAVTILGGYAFLGIKSIEYHHKWQHVLFIGTHNQFRNGYTGSKFLQEEENKALPGHADATPPPGVITIGARAIPGGAGSGPEIKPGPTSPEPAHPAQTPTASAETIAAEHQDKLADSFSLLPPDPNKGTGDQAKIEPPFINPPALAPSVIQEHKAELELSDLSRTEQERLYTFFAVYFFMTGLHGIHVVIGMSLICWVLIRASGPRAAAWLVPMIPLSIGLFLATVGVIIYDPHPEHGGAPGNAWLVLVCLGAIIAMISILWALWRVPRRRSASDEGEFGPTYYTPVDLSGLYWHLVDLIWIFLFPLLYLIH